MRTRAQALATLAVGSAWSCSDDYSTCLSRIDAVQKRHRQRAVRGRSGTATSEGEGESEEDEAETNGNDAERSLEVTPCSAACFVVVASTVLILMYFLISDLM